MISPTNHISICSTATAVKLLQMLRYRSFSEEMFQHIIQPLFMSQNMTTSLKVRQGEKEKRLVGQSNRF